VSIDSDDDLVFGGSNAEIQRGWRTRRRIVDYANSRICRGKRVGNFASTVAAWAYGDDHFQLTWVLLVKNPANSSLQVPFLVQHRHDDRDTGPPCPNVVEVDGRSHSPILELLAHRAHGSTYFVVARRGKAPLLPPPQHGGRAICRRSQLISGSSLQLRRSSCTDLAQIIGLGAAGR